MWLNVSLTENKKGASSQGTRPLFTTGSLPDSDTDLCNFKSRAGFSHCSALFITAGSAVSYGIRLISNTLACIGETYD